MTRPENISPAIALGRLRLPHKRVLVAILVIAAGLRLGLALWLPSEPTWSDGRWYDGIARAILTTGEYPRADYRSGGPLQPLLLALSYLLTGGSGTAARVLMAVLGTLTCLAVFRLGQTLFDSVVGIVACAALAIYPMHVYISATYEYPQCAFILLLVSTAALAASLSVDPQGWGRWIAAGSTLGLAALSVPTILTAAPLIAIWLLIVCRLRWPARLARIAILTAATTCVVLGWGAYRYSSTGEFNLVSGAGAETLFKGNCPLAWELGKADIADLYEKEGCPPEHRQAYAAYLEVEGKALTFPPGAQRNAVYYDAAKQYFVENPGDAVKLLARKAVLYWLPYSQPVTKHAADSGYTRILQTAAFVPVFVLAILGVAMNRTRPKPLFLLILIILAQWVTYTAHIVTARYRLQIDPLLIVLGASAIVLLARHVRSRFRRRQSPGLSKECRA